VSSVDEAGRREVAAEVASSLVVQLSVPFDAVHVGSEVGLRRGARRDVPEDGEQHRDVVGVLEREDERTSSGHCSANANENPWTDWTVGYP
jgi:hypothetical protein